jgi:hypothetical protein
MFKPNPFLRLIAFAIAIGMTTPLSAQQAATADDDGGPKPLNLSLPRGTASPPGANSGRDSTPRDKEMSGRTRLEADDVADARYGTGFEARRRGLGGRGFGRFGGGAAGGGGRGMGRGR